MAGRPKGAPRDKAIALRLPSDLHDRLSAAAAGRSVSEEIRRRLEASFDMPGGDAADDARFANLLKAIGYAASVAAAMYPAPDPRGAAVFEEAAIRLGQIYQVQTPTVFDDDMRSGVNGAVLMALGKLGATAPEFVRAALATRDAEQGDKR
jgi:hypothetical protein